MYERSTAYEMKVMRPGPLPLTFPKSLKLSHMFLSKQLCQESLLTKESNTTASCITGTSSSNLIFSSGLVKQVTVTAVTDYRRVRIRGSVCLVSGHVVHDHAIFFF